MKESKNTGRKEIHMYIRDKHSKCIFIFTSILIIRIRVRNIIFRILFLVLLLIQQYILVVY